MGDRCSWGGKGNFELPNTILKVTPLSTAQASKTQAGRSGCFSLPEQCPPGRVTGGPCAALTYVSHCSVFPGLGLLLPATRALQPLQRDATLQPAGRQLSA